MSEFEHKEIELKPVSHITTDAIGAPGKRIFYLQGTQGGRVVTLILEKFQLQTLTIGVEQFLAEIYQRLPGLEEASDDFEEERMRIHPPLEPLFRVAEFGLSYDGETDLVGLIARELPTQNISSQRISSDEPETEPETGPEPEQGTVVKFWCTRAQVRALVHWGMEIVNRGRPLCPQCGQPMDPEGHFCARKNGHKS